MFTVQLIKAGVCWSLFPDFKALAALQFYLTLTALKCCKSFWRGGKGIDSNSSNYGGVKVVAFWKAACTSSSSLACFLACDTECYYSYCRSLLDATFVTFYMPRKLA